MEVLHENPDLQAMDFKAAFGADSSPAVKNELTPTNPNSGGGVGGFQEEDGGAIKTENREIWLGHGDVSNGVGPSSLFYADDDFPPLPEFPCMSSSSSTPTTPAPSTSTVPTAGFSTSGATSSSSSSSSSWAMLKSDAEAEDDYHNHQNNNNNNNNQQQQQQKQSYDDDDRMDGVECMNVMEDFDCMGINQLIEDSNEIWDPTPLFEDQSQIPQTQTQTHLISPFDQQFQHHHHDDRPFLFLDPDTRELDPPESASALSEDLAVVFFEWLKSNKESISAEELRSIKIKKSTIESAAKRLGGGKEGMKQLLKLILQWVQNHRLHTKRSRAESDFTQPSPEPLPLPPQLLPDPELPNPNPNYPNLIIQHEPQLCFNPQQQQPWMSPYITDPGGVAIAPAPSSFTSMVSYIGGGHDPYATTVHQPYHAPPPPPDQYHHMIDGSSWAGPPPPQFPPGPMHYNTGPDGSLMAPQGYPGYGYNPYQFFPGPGGDGLVRMGSSATKEARKKRMARQRRVFTHHHHRGQHHGNGGQQQQMIQDPNARVMIGDHDGAAHGGWVYWPPTPGACGGGPMPMMGSMQQQPHQPAGSERTGVAASTQGSQRQATTDKKQVFKTEKNLKFLLQKVLKQSDVGNLGRIVLPKKEAESHLPELEARDGIPIAMEDIGTSRVWNMRYRFWPNNKSRMYLLENTGDFVRSNGLQEGDFIVIYSDVKCGKYMIRGVKVRPQQQGSKAELAKKPSKALKTQNSASPAGTALSPLTHRHRQ